MPRYADIPYNPTATVAPQTGMPNDYLNVRANPAQMGAEIGGALQKAGGTLEQVGSEGMQVAIQQQGMLNEAAATDADVALSKLHGEIMGKYRTLQGVDAVNARDSYMQQAIAAREKIADSLPNPAARRAFDMLSARSTGYILRDMGNYAAGQVRVATVNAHNAALNNSIDSLSDPAIANDNVAIGDRMGNIRYAVNTMMQDNGYASVMHQDPKTGQISFDSTPEGQQASAVYQDYMNKALDKAYTNIAETKAFDAKTGNVAAAVDWLQANKDKMPAATYAKLSAKFAAPYRSYQASSVADDVTSNLRASYLQHIGSFQQGQINSTQFLSAITKQETGGGISDPKNINQIQPATWAAFSKPGENIANPKDNNIVAQRYINHLFQVAGGDPERVAVGYFSGEGNIAPAGSPTPWKQDSADKNGKTVSSYVADMTNRLSRSIPGARPTGWMPEADYFRTHFDSAVQTARDAYLIRHPDDIQGADAAASHTEQRLRNVISTQELSLRAQRDQLLGTVLGNNKQSPITSMEQLEGPTADPKIKEAWANYELNEPYGAQTMRNLVANNAKGHSKTLGADFYSHYLDALAGKINDPTTLAPYLTSTGGNPDDAPVTSKGFNVIRQQLQNMQTPEGQAFAHAELQFFQNIKGQITGTGAAPGAADPMGDKLFNKFLSAAIPQIEAGRTAGKTAADLFNNPQSPDYIGKLVGAYQRDSKTMLQDVMKYSTTAKQFFGGPQNTNDIFSSIPEALRNKSMSPDEARAKLKAAIEAKQITRTQAVQFGIEQGLLAPAPPPVPLAGQ